MVFGVVLFVFVVLTYLLVDFAYDLIVEFSGFVFVVKWFRWVCFDFVCVLLWLLLF